MLNGDNSEFRIVIRFWEVLLACRRVRKSLLSFLHGSLKKRLSSRIGPLLDQKMLKTVIVLSYASRQSAGDLAILENNGGF